jgi:hypothetical protein
MTKLSFKYYIFLFVIAVSIVSCEELVDVELSSSGKVLVAEGLIEPDESAWLQLSYTYDYFTEEEPVYIENSKVILTDGKGIYDTLVYKGEGMYRGSRIEGEVGCTYTVSVSIDDDEYLASSELLAPSSIENVWFIKTSTWVFGELESKTAYKIHVAIQNDIDQDNYYLFRFYADGELRGSRYTLGNSSFYSDWEKLEYSPVGISFEKGEKVKVVLYRIDEGAYYYFSQLNDLNENTMGGISTPYNPQSNFGDDFMGFFLARSYDSVETVVR